MAAISEREARRACSELISAVTPSVIASTVRISGSGDIPASRSRNGEATAGKQAATDNQAFEKRLCGVQTGDVAAGGHEGKQQAFAEDKPRIRPMATGNINTSVCRSA